MISAPQSVVWLHMDMGRLVNVGLYIPGVDAWVWIGLIPAHVIQWMQFIHGVPVLYMEILDLLNNLNTVSSAPRSVV